MYSIPNLLMIGGNSRNAGKTTLACRIISRLSQDHEVIGLKVTSIRPGEDDLHGDHSEDGCSDYEIIEEWNPSTQKDTSLMLQSGAIRVFYIRTTSGFLVKAVKEFFNLYVSSQPVICESRSLREYIVPGLFVMMMRLPAVGKAKDVSHFLEKADKIFIFDNDNFVIDHFIINLIYENQKFHLLGK